MRSKILSVILCLLCWGLIAPGIVFACDDPTCDPSCEEKVSQDSRGLEIGPPIAQSIIGGGPATATKPAESPGTQASAAGKTPQQYKPQGLQPTAAAATEKKRLARPCAWP